MDQPHPAGLKPTVRQMMIVIVWAALLAAVARLAIGWRGLWGPPEVFCLVLALNISVFPMPLLAILLWLLDRPGSVRAWYCSACLIGADFLGGVVFSLQDLISYAMAGRPTILFPTGLVLAIVAFTCGWLRWRQARPRPCPACGRPAVIPIAHPTRPASARKVNTGKQGWCASCGASFEREGKGPWRKGEAEAGPRPLNSRDDPAEAIGVDPGGGD